MLDFLIFAVTVIIFLIFAVVYLYPVSILFLVLCSRSHHTKLMKKEIEENSKRLEWSEAICCSQVHQVLKFAYVR